MFITKNQHISTVLNENTIGLVKLLIPQEQCALVNVFNYTSSSFILSWCYSDYIIWIDSVSVLIYSGCLLSKIDLLVDFSHLYILNFSIVIDDFQVIFMHLQYYSNILIVVHNEIISRILRDLLLIYKTRQ